VIRSGIPESRVKVIPMGNFHLFNKGKTYIKEEKNAVLFLDT